MNRHTHIYSKFLLTACITLGAMSSQAQSVYLCGQSPKTYSDRPCVDGKVLPQTAVEPTSAERAEAQKVAERERKLAHDLAQNRLAQERGAKSGATGMDTRMRVTRSAPAEPIRIKIPKSKRVKLHAPSAASKPAR
jgi:hypothetical protein